MMNLSLEQALIEVWRKTLVENSKSVELGTERFPGRQGTQVSAMTDDELLAFGKQMHGFVYPLTYDHRGKPSVSVFSAQLDEARSEWKRHDSGAKNPRSELHDGAA